jgi:hypothetical protein
MAFLLPIVTALALGYLTWRGTQSPVRTALIALLAVPCLLGWPLLAVYVIAALVHADTRAALDQYGEQAIIGFSLAVWAWLAWVLLAPRLRSS